MRGRKKAEEEGRSYGREVRAEKRETVRRDECRGPAGVWGREGGRLGRTRGRKSRGSTFLIQGEAIKMTEPPLAR